MAADGRNGQRTADLGEGGGEVGGGNGGKSAAGRTGSVGQVGALEAAGVEERLGCAGRDCCRLVLEHSDGLVGDHPLRVAGVRAVARIPGPPHPPGPALSEAGDAGCVLYAAAAAGRPGVVGHRSSLGPVQRALPLLHRRRLDLRCKFPISTSSGIGTVAS